MQRQDTVRQPFRTPLTLLAATAAGRLGAAPLEGEVSASAASLLALLGLLALLMGVRNLRALRYRQSSLPAPRRPRPRKSAEEPVHSSDVL